MSRGPGKWQRLILEALELREWVIVNDLLPDTAKRAQFSALNRAAHKLGEAGKVQITHRTRPVQYENPRAIYGLSTINPYNLVAARLGVDVPVYYGHTGEWMPRSVWLGMRRARTEEEHQAVYEAWKVSVEEVSTRTPVPHLEKV